MLVLHVAPQAIELAKYASADIRAHDFFNSKLGEISSWLRDISKIGTTSIVSRSIDSGEVRLRLRSANVRAREIVSVNRWGLCLFWT